MTLAGILKFTAIFFNIANKKPRHQPSDVIVPDFLLSGKRNCVVEQRLISGGSKLIEQTLRPCSYCTG